MPIKTEKRVGNRAFHKVFDRHAHPDDWGVHCVYDYSAWRIWKAAIRYERSRQGKTEQPK